jgi:hypothetical protein
MPNPAWKTWRAAKPKKPNNPLKSVTKAGRLCRLFCFEPRDFGVFACYLYNHRKLLRISLYKGGNERGTATT